MASIDRMDWHYGGDFPQNLPLENGGTHIGMFLTWIIENDLIGEMHREDSPEAIHKVKSRQMTGRDFLMELCDEKLWEEDFNEEGYAFAQHYYQFENSGTTKKYIEDYLDTLGENAASIYEIENSWSNYDKLKPVIDKRYQEWEIFRKEENSPHIEFPASLTITQASNGNPEQESIGGQWYGFFSYGPEYGPELEGEKVVFSFLIEEQITGQFTGKCIELHGIGASEEVSYIKGYMENGFISFTKEYKTYKVLDEWGNELNYKGTLAPRLSYKGHYDAATLTVSGDWELIANEMPYGDGTYVDICTGRWEMSRHADTYGV